MSFTVLFAALAFLALIITFGLTYQQKGLKTAFLAAGIAFIAFAILFASILFVIANSMAN
jgi:hypothetical protein